ncbi:hypothetical protein B0H15DRAFT_853854 [Mycena belliarum]|uniref:Uncharacterized protein n=1 Tax=Mycena belliarum TaxID=1033014 RepID=A0AAD6XR55_9AGAR|nr:hypothetical protein B0H15DRAFT_853854 [Mycena belliae]
MRPADPSQAVSRRRGRVPAHRVPKPYLPCPVPRAPHRARSRCGTRSHAGRVCGAHAPRAAPGESAPGTRREAGGRGVTRPLPAAFAATQSAAYPGTALWRGSCAGDPAREASDATSRGESRHAPRAARFCHGVRAHLRAASVEGEGGRAQSAGREWRAGLKGVAEDSEGGGGVARAPQIRRLVRISASGATRVLLTEARLGSSRRAARIQRIRPAHRIRETSARTRARARESAGCGARRGVASPPRSDFERSRSRRVGAGDSSSS